MYCQVNSTRIACSSLLVIKSEISSNVISRRLTLARWDVCCGPDLQCVMTRCSMSRFTGSCERSCYHCDCDFLLIVFSCMLVISESKVGMYSVIKPWKAFARHYAWVVVAATPNLSVGVQMQHLMAEYKKCVVLMVEGRLQYQGDWMPTQPAELTILGSEAALQLFLQSTAKVGSSTTEAALYHKVKADVKLVHQFMSDWCTLCPCASRQSTCFLPATVPDGQCRDGVFAQILLSRESYRTNELNVCFK